MTVAEFEAQSAHLFHGMYRNFNELSGFHTRVVAFVIRFGEYVAILNGLPNHYADFGTVLGHFAHTLLGRFKPFEVDRHIELAVRNGMFDDIAGNASGDHIPAPAFLSWLLLRAVVRVRRKSKAIVSRLFPM